MIVVVIWKGNITAHRGWRPRSAVQTGGLNWIQSLPKHVDRFRFHRGVIPMSRKVELIRNPDAHWSDDTHFAFPGRIGDELVTVKVPLDRWPDICSSNRDGEKAIRCLEHLAATVERESLNYGDYRPTIFVT